MIPSKPEKQQRKLSEIVLIVDTICSANHNEGEQLKSPSFKTDHVHHSWSVLEENTQLELHSRQTSMAEEFQNHMRRLPVVVIGGLIVQRNDNSISN